MDLHPLTVQMLVLWSRYEAKRGEACGLLQPEMLTWCPNVAARPEVGFEMGKPAKSYFFGTEVLATGLTSFAVWHSHLYSRAAPTPPDIALMQQLTAYGKLDVPMVIVGLQSTVPDVSVYVLDTHNPDRAILVRSYRPGEFAC